MGRLGFYVRVLNVFGEIRFSGCFVKRSLNVRLIRFYELDADGTLILMYASGPEVAVRTKVDIMRASKLECLDPLMRKEQCFIVSRSISHFVLD